MPGHPLGLNDYQEFGPIKMVGGGGGGDKSNEADTDGSDGDGTSRFSG